MTPAPLEVGHLRERPLEVGSLTGRLGLLHARVLPGAFVDPAADQIDHVSLGDGERLARDLGILGAKALDLPKQTAMQMPPLMHQFGQAIPLLPSLEAVLDVFLGGGGIGGGRLGAAGADTQLALESVQHLRDVVVELRTREEIRRHLDGITVSRRAPRK